MVIFLHELSILAYERMVFMNTVNQELNFKSRRVEMIVEKDETSTIKPRSDDIILSCFRHDNPIFISSLDSH